MSYVIDNQTIDFLEGIATSAGGAITIVVAYLYKKGYIDIILTKIFTPIDEIHALRKQNGNALDKLNTEDDLFCILESFELDQNGHIVLKGEGRVSKLLRQDRPLTSYEKDEIIKAVRKIFTTCKNE